MKKEYRIFVVAFVVLVVGMWYAVMYRAGEPEIKEEAMEVVQEQQTPELPEEQAVRAGGTPTRLPPPPSVPVIPEPVSEPAPEPTPEISYKNTDGSEVFIALPQSGQVVAPSFVVAGTALGNWYSPYGHFTLEIHSESGDMLVRVQALAEGNWRTTGMVQFSTSVTLPPDYIGPVTAVLRSPDVSGLPEREKSVSIPVSVE